MVRQLERLLTIDTLIRGNQRQTASGLAEVLEISERTVRSDLAFLRDRFGAPLVFKKARGWHYTNQNWRLPTIALTKGEVFALTLGARMLDAYAGSTYHPELVSAIEQLSQRLPEETLVDLQQIAKDRVLFHPGAAVHLKPEVWQKLQFACQLSQQVQVRYFTASRNTESERIIDPYVLHISRLNPYVTGFCHQRQAVRDFRVDRIRSLEVLPDTFMIHPDFDPQTHLNSPFLHEQGGEPTSVAIWFDLFTAPYIRERKWHSTQEIEEHSDGSLTLRFVTRSLNEVKRWVLFYGKGAIVREPAELVVLVGQEVEQMNKHYLGSNGQCC